ncbi:MAG: riboflavin synthase [Armatimonadota bacterium]|nr:riboflavin synthase [Armatimonadota bacterium]
MFTGLIQEVGAIRRVRPSGGGADLQIQAPQIGPQTEVGESVAINGACLTVEAPGDDGFTCHAGAETLARTTLGELSVGAGVNLERALSVGDRLGGHFVQGHVDCVGRIAARRDEGTTAWFSIEVPPEHARYVVEKGSVAVDGISLTVTEVAGVTFEVAIIPYTLANTTLGTAGPGQRVNIETDILAKYVERLTGGEPEADISTDFLAEHGFI